jgi:aspartate racemase
MIGIVGGMGPYSGTDLLNKIFDNTLAQNDQEHLDAILLSTPSGIDDRTQFLLGKVKVNPAFAITEVILKLEKMGATIAGIPCNTAHSNRIFSVIQQELKKAGSTLHLLNMIDETIKFMASNYPEVNKVGVLSTTGTYKNRLYSEPLIAQGFEVIEPTLEMQENVIHPAIYDSVYGIKTVSNPVHPQAKKNLLQGISFLKQSGAEAVILGCSEIPLAIPEPTVQELFAIDPTNILARRLIYLDTPGKLKPL